jgi:uncharacterized protein (DUF427 family)
MQTKVIQLPGPDHPLTVEPGPESVVAEPPYPAVAAIKDHVASYTDKVDAIERHPVAAG